MMKKLFIMAVVLAVAGGALAAQIITNRAGQVITTYNTSNTADTYKDITFLRDQSIYPTQNDRRGLIVRWWDFSEDDCTGTVTLARGASQDIPDNFLVYGGYVQTITAITPSGSTNCISLVTSNDILATGTTLDSAAFSAITPVYTIGTAVQTTSATNLTIFFDGTTPTAGVVMVVLDGYLAQ